MVDVKMAKNQMDIQLKETSQLTGANWAIWLEHTTDWEPLAFHKLSPQNRSAFLRYIRTAAINGWLNGALTGKRSRSRTISLRPGCQVQSSTFFQDSNDTAGNHRRRGGTSRVFRNVFGGWLPWEIQEVPF